MQLLYCVLLLPGVITITPSSLFDTCYGRYNLEDSKPTLYYAERCRSLKNALDCFDRDTKYLYFDYLETYYYDDMLDGMKKLAVKACALGHSTYCPANILKDKMKSCATRHGVTSMTNITASFAGTHYWSLRDALLCMEREIKICPDDDYLQSYVVGIQEWRTQLDIMTNRTHTTTTVMYSSTGRIAFTTTTVMYSSTGRIEFQNICNILQYLIILLTQTPILS